MKKFYKIATAFYYEKTYDCHAYDYFEERYPRLSIKRLSKTCPKWQIQKKTLLLFMKLLKHNNRI